jgi:hypothetical protein
MNWILVKIGKRKFESFAEACEALGIKYHDKPSEALDLMGIRYRKIERKVAVNL